MTLQTLRNLGKTGPHLRTWVHHDKTTDVRRKGNFAAEEEDRLRADGWLPLEEVVGDSVGNEGREGTASAEATQIETSADRDEARNALPKAQPRQQPVAAPPNAQQPPAAPANRERTAAPAPSVNQKDVTPRTDDSK